MTNTKAMKAKLDELYCHNKQCRKGPRFTLGRADSPPSRRNWPSLPMTCKPAWRVCWPNCGLPVHKRLRVSWP